MKIRKLPKLLFRASLIIRQSMYPTELAKSATSLMIFVIFLCYLHPAFAFGIEIGKRLVDFFRDFREKHAGRAGHQDSDEACDCHVGLLGLMVALVP